MEIVTAIVTPVVESLMVPFKKHLGYVFSYAKYLRDMGTKKRLLEAKILGVENHVKRNKRNNLEVPPEVESWLEEVVKIDAQVESIPSDVGSCFNIKLRHKLGRKAFKIIEEINRVIEENSTINWTDHPIPLGKVDSMKASTFTPPGDHNDFRSREKTFMEALKALQPDHKSQMIALCGMGGVGKTTMMEKLRKVVEENKLFNLIVKVVIGEKMNTIAIQDAVADYLGICLTEKSESARSDQLRKIFEAEIDGGKKKILVILDDVWQFVHLNDIGLCPLPNQGAGFKFLLTSRDQSVCTMMGVEATSIFKVDVIEEREATTFFQRFVEFSNDDHELHQIGEDIVRKCCGLPIAIRTIAITLKGKRKDAWIDARSRLENHDIYQVVREVFLMSYTNLKDQEIESFFLLCGLFPEDFDIPTEDLVRYGWGLEIFNKVYSISYARTRLNTCIEKLILANLLIESQKVGCVKMHDLVRDFALYLCSNGEHMSIVGNKSSWPVKLMSDSCKRISLTCTGMFELPRNFKFPNLSLLKFMHGDESLTFPKDFYENMKNLQVIAYDKMKYPLFCRSLQCSTNLRTLCLRECLWLFDFSSIGDLLNLEVLSFAHCRIKKLPSTIGNLKELKLLDLTGCDDLCIDDDVLINLVKLEELYMRTYKGYGKTKKGIRFTHSNRDELVECSKNLSSLEIEFFDNKDLPNNISLKKLERFKISLGCHLEDNDGENMHSFINTLMLVTNKCKLLDSKMNELFEKTEVLHLHVDDMNDLGEVLVESLHHHPSSFYNLRVLHLCECVNLKYIFTVTMANGLKKLEYLEIFKCHFLETVVDSKNGGVEVIKFPALKFLYLGYLPNLKSLCNDVNAIELPQLEELILESLPNFTSIYAISNSSDNFAMQPLLRKEVVFSQLKRLEIRNMEKLTEIWPSDTKEVGFSELRVIILEGCDSVVNLFPSNPMPLLHHLEELEVRYCCSIDVIFSIDLGRIGEIEKTGICLRKIHVQELQKLTAVWKINGANKSMLLICCGLQAVQHLEIKDCVRFKNRFTLTISDGGESGRDNELIMSTQKQEITVISNEDITQVGDTVVVVPSHLILDLHHLHTISINNCEQVDVVFEMEIISSRTDTTQQALKDLRLENMESMSHVWKCNWSKFLISQKQPRSSSSSSFHNLTTIYLYQCKNIKYLFSPLMAKLLSNLKAIHITHCRVIKEVVSNRDDGDEELVASMFTNTSTSLFPYLDVFSLDNLPSLKRIGGGGSDGNEISFSNTNTTTSMHDQFKFSQVDVPWSLCQYSRTIRIDDCHVLSTVIPSYAVGHMQKLEKLRIWGSKTLVEIFETRGGCCSGNIDEEGGGGTNIAVAIPRLKCLHVPQLSNLKTLDIDSCHHLEHIFTFSTLESLMQLQELVIRNCKRMKVIVKEEHGDQATMTSSAAKVVIFPRLKSIELYNLPKITGFFLGTNEFHLPSLDDVSIIHCPQMTVFTSGHLIAPKLKYIKTRLGKLSLECGFNNFLLQNPLSCFDGTSSCPATSAGCPCSFHNMIEMDVSSDSDVKKIIPPSKLQQLQKLEKIHARCYYLVEEIFEAPERPDGELQSVVVKFPKLREVFLYELRSLKYIWKNNPWMVLEFPNVTTLSISRCRSMEHVFTSSMIGSLLQLQRLDISYCAGMEVIVVEAKVVVEEEEEECDEIITLPRLKSLKLKNLPSLKGFCLGKEAFSWPSLDTLEIIECPAITIFTMGHSTTPKLEVIDTNLGKRYVREDLNSFIKTSQEKGLFEELEEEEEEEEEDT